jgi:hypothetical protein
MREAIQHHSARAPRPAVGAAQHRLIDTLAIGEETEMPDVMEAVRYGTLEEPPDNSSTASVITLILP